MLGKVKGMITDRILLGTNIGEIFDLSVDVFANLPLSVFGSRLLLSNLFTIRFGSRLLLSNLFTDGGPDNGTSRQRQHDEATMEPADKDSMVKPPRSKNQNIMTSTCLTMVIGVTITAMYMHIGLIQQSEIEGLCEFMINSELDKNKTSKDIGHIEIEFLSGSPRDSVSCDSERCCRLGSFQ